MANLIANKSIAFLDIIDSLPSLFFEFKDNIKTYTEESTGQKYTQSVSPLFDKDVIDDSSNSELLYLIASKVPYYFIEPTRMVNDVDGTPEEYILQDTRDCGINNVPSVMQKNSFWQTWFQNTWGYLYNALLLNIYNTLQYPYVNENLFLNNTLYTKLIKKAFNESDASKSYIGFVDTEEENDAVYDTDYEFYGEEIGCLDNIQDIVSQKIESEYYLIDYKDISTPLLNKWGESLYASGQMNKEELDSAKLLYKLQDIKNELMRRKLAGSKTLYSMIIESIDRKGGFVPTITEAEISNSRSTYYNNKRLFRVISLPGITTQFVDFNSGNVNYGSLINTYNLKSEDIPISTLVPLFYNSSTLSDSGSTISYDSDKFYNFSLDDTLSLDKFNLSNTNESYRTTFLRDNSNIIDWNNLKSINLSDSVAISYTRMDTQTDIDEEGNPVYTKLDNITAGEYDIMDNSSSKLDFSTSTSSVLDISADRVLYHRNTVQDSLEINYPYVTYPIADGNGLSLMDTYWLDYIEKEVKYKSKVQDNTELGVQLSTIKQFYDNDIYVDHDFFAVSYTDINYKETGESLDNIEIRDYKEGDRFALLWYCTITYKDNADGTEKTTKFFTKRLISVISIISNFDTSKLSKYTDSDYDDFKSYNLGVLPLTHTKVVDNVAWKTYSGFYKDSSGNYDFVDDISDSNYGMAMYIFTSNSNLSSSILNGLNPSITNNYLYANKLCTVTPTSNTKAIFFVNKRLDSNNEYHYYWSDAIRVISLYQFLNGFTSESNLDGMVVYESDSTDLCFYINPYLNFNENCASPLRHSQVLKNSCLNTLKEDGSYDTDNFVYTTGGTKTSLLSSLITENTWLCNDLGLSTVKSSDDTYGYYLQKTNIYTEGASDTEYTFSYNFIQGDNRVTEKAIYEASNYDVEDYISYSSITDTNNIDCISITPSLIIKTTTPYGKIQTLDLVPYKNVGTGTVKWDWKNSKNKSIFFELSFNCLSNAIPLKDEQIKSFSTADTILPYDSNSLFVKESDNTLYLYDTLEGKLKEHSMYIISYGTFSLYIASNGVITLNVNNKTISCAESKIIWSNLSDYGTFNIGVSFTEITASLCVNNEYVETTTPTATFNTFSSNTIPLFRKGGSTVDTTTLFYGNIYSVRIYNRAMNNKTQMLLTNEGTFRELYSLAPSNYKLAHTVYKDIAVFKQTVNSASTVTNAFPNITEIRLFSRSVWDSILLDNSPKDIIESESYDPKEDTDIYTTVVENGEKKYYLNNCVEQELLTTGDYLEYNNGVSLEFLDNSDTNSVNVFYRDYDNPLVITSNDHLALLNTLIEPLSYSEEEINSGSNITINFSTTDINSLTQTITSEEDLTQFIKIPKTIDSSDDSFTYSADTNFNFKVTPSLNMARWLAKGSNVDLQCITKEGTPIVVATLLDSNVFSTTKNNIVLPLVIPYQTDKKDLYLDKFYFKNVVLNSSLVSFLDATNYYTEVRFPVLVNYDVDTYTITKGLKLTKTSDVTYNSSKKYFTILDYASSIMPYYQPKVNSIVYKQLGDSQSPNTDTPVTEMERGEKYYIWERGGATTTSFTFTDGYSKDSLYFTLSDDGNGNKAYVPYNESTFDVDTAYYKSTYILNDFTGTSFTSGITYYEDVIASNTYYTYANDVYTLYTAGGTFSNLNSGIVLYTKSTINTLKYINKWDALRTLKTGTYYFTCKYPVQIMPFMDNVFDGDSDHSYTTYYASTRFKVEVQQKPYLMDSSEYAIDGTPITYRANNLINTIKSSANRYSPEDNSTFPHMKVEIDLYALDCNNIAGQMNSDDTENYTFKWVLVASNNKTEEDVISLTKGAINDTIVLSKEIPMFLEKSYTSSFFVSSRKKLADGTFTDAPDSADDDIVCPIKIVGDYLNKRDEEYIKAYSEEDMDKQILISGKSYKIIFDYTAKVSEISYTDECYENTILSDSEKTNYSRLVNLLDTDFLNASDYMYDSDGRSFNLVGNINVLNRTSGYKLNESSGYYNWEQDTFSTIVSENSTFAFGNPYSRASTKNYRLYNKTKSTTLDSRSNINNSYTYPYMVTEDTHGIVVPSYSTKISALSTNFTISEVTLDETDIMLGHYNEIKNSISAFISSLKSKATGLFNGFSEVEPNYNGISSTTNKEIAVNNETYKLYGYYSNNRLLPLGNSNLTITRKSLYSNNLLKNSSFDNTNYWIINDGATNWGYTFIANNNTAGYGSTWEADTTWDDGIGKDVFKIIDRVSSGNATITMKYNGGSVGLNSIFESAINLKVITSTISKVQASYYYNGKFWKTVDLTATSIGDGWVNYGGSTTDSDSCDSIIFTISFTGAVGACYITKAVVRKCNTTSHKLGFSDALNEVNLNNKSSYVGINGHSIVMFKYPETRNAKTYARIYPDEYFPIQFNNTLYNTTSAGGKTIYRPKSGTYRIGEFISNNKLVSAISSESRIMELLNPFTRRIYVSKNSDKINIVIHKYGMYANAFGVYNKEESYSSTFDIISQMSSKDVTITESQDGKYFLIKFNRIPLDITDNKEFSSYNVNLQIDESTPMKLSNERFSMLFNSFYPELYRKGTNYSVAVTNIQLLGTVASGKKIYFELEFLPIIYSELKNHLSFNLMLYKKGSAS